MRRLLFILVAVAVLTSAPTLVAAEPGPWSAVLYGARNSGDSFGKTLRGEADYTDDYLAALSLNRRIGSYRHLWRFEIELQVAKHFDVEEQWEGNGAFVVRWLAFWWDNLVDTSFAVGEGISVASEISEVESSYRDESRKTLNYVFLEFDFFLPSHPHWGMVARLHHRSGVFGLFDGEQDAANAVGLGLKYRF